MYTSGKRLIVLATVSGSSSRLVLVIIIVAASNSGRQVYALSNIFIFFCQQFLSQLKSHVSRHLTFVKSGQTQSHYF